MKTVNERYIPGDYYMECDRCGLSYRRSELRRDGWKLGLMVCEECWDFKPTYPAPPPDRIAVPIARPKQETTASGISFNTITIGFNLFPDPDILPVNDGLWSTGTDSQLHAKTEYYSKKLDGVDSDIAVSGLKVGETYRLTCSTWTPDTARILIDGVNSTLFTDPEIEMWYTDTIYFIAEATSIVLSFLGSMSINFYDDIHVQKYDSHETIMSPADIIANKIPKDDITDNTIIGVVIEFFAFDGGSDFNDTGLDDGTLVDQLE